MKNLTTCVLVSVALVLIAIAAGKWLEGVSQEFEEAESRENG